jgi:5-enolpyruvylshikimate-3-phosphate synthase
MRSRPTAELLDSLRESKRDLHASQRDLPLPEKIRQVLALQKIDYVLRSTRGELRWWEKPWEIDF